MRFRCEILELAKQAEFLYKTLDPAEQRHLLASTINTPAQTLEAVGGTFGPAVRLLPMAIYKRTPMSDQTDLIRGTLDLLTMRTFALEPRLSPDVDPVRERT